MFHLGKKRVGRAVGRVTGVAFPLPHTLPLPSSLHTSFPLSSAGQDSHPPPPINRTAQKLGIKPLLVLGSFFVCLWQSNHLRQGSTSLRFSPHTHTHTPHTKNGGKATTGELSRCSLLVVGGFFPLLLVTAFA